MAEEESKAEQPVKKGKGGLMIVAVLVLLLLAGGGAALYFLVLHKPSVEESLVAPELPATAAKPQAEPGPIMPYTAFLVNLADAGGKRYLRFSLSLELSKHKNFQQEVEQKDAKIKDIIISIISSKTFEEISTPQGKIALKQEILRRLNTIMSGGKVEDVFFTEFVVQ
ncbi:MAG: flagellar basal body-associated FliL family protein [Deferribacteraceae bacterium]|jgi:flagellar FliL protein|nr:flagellar basal body-associated FliL family protein [Deferribacteraceae bacterium]